MSKYEFPSEVVYALRAELDIISKQIYKEKLPAKITPNEDGTFSIEITLNRDFFIKISLDKKFKLSVSFYQTVEDYDRPIRQLVPKKQFVPQSALDLGRYNKGSYILNIEESISAPTISAIKVLVSERQSLKKCVMSHHAILAMDNSKKSIHLGKLKQLCFLFGKWNGDMGLLVFLNLNNLYMKHYQVFMGPMERMLDIP